MLHVCFDCSSKCIFRSFHKISTSTTVYVDFYTARYYIHTFCVNYFCADNSQIAISNFKDFIVTNYYRTVFKPSLWR